MSVEELDTHPGAGRLERAAERGQRPRRDGTDVPHDLATLPGPEDAERPVAFGERVRAARHWVSGHRGALLRGTGLVAVGALLGAGLAAERNEARVRAALEDTVDVAFLGTAGPYQGDGVSAGTAEEDEPAASLALRNDGPLPLEVVGARAGEGEPVTFTAVLGDSPVLEPGEQTQVALAADVDCRRMRFQQGLEIVLLVRSRSGTVHDEPLDTPQEGLGPWSFGWCAGSGSSGLVVDVRYERPLPVEDPSTFAAALSVTSREDEVLQLRGVDPPFPTVSPTSGLQEVTTLPPGRPVEAAVRFDLPGCTEMDQVGVSEGLALYVVPAGEDATLSDGPSVYASGGIRFQRDLLDAIDRRCPRGSSGS